MKKLSLLMALILCVTIGGVYAAWVYANPDTEVAKDVPVGVGLNVETSGHVGTYALEFTGTPFAVEPTSTTDYTAQLKKMASVYLVFTPVQNADQDILDNGIDTYLYIKNKAALESLVYNGQKIFTITQFDSHATAKKIEMSASDKQPNGSFKIEITDIILSAIDLIDISLPTRQAYNEFEAAMEPGGQAVNISIALTSKAAA